MKVKTIEGPGGTTVTVTLFDEIPFNDLVSKGWDYIDPPTKFTHEMWDLFLSVIGEGNYKVLVMSECPEWKRGQLLISPEGANNLKSYQNRS